MLVPSLKEKRIQLRNRNTIKTVSNKICISIPEKWRPGVIQENFLEEAVPLLGTEGWAEWSTLEYSASCELLQARCICPELL